QQSTIFGTIIEIGAAGNTFTCTGVLNTYRVLDSNGNSYLVTTTPSTTIQSSLGNFLRIGDVVQITGIVTGSGNSFYATQVVANSGTGSLGSGFSTIPVNNSPLLGNGNIGFTNNGTYSGTITAAGCNGDYFFVDQYGTGYVLQLNSAIAGVPVTLGTRLNVTGQVVGNQLIATNAYPNQSQVNFPVTGTSSGTIVSLVNTQTLSCGTTINTYTFQNDNGMSQQLRVANNAATGGFNQQQYFVAGSRVLITSKVESANGSTIDALSIVQQNLF
ncbi:MAG: hypothetical protein R3240_09360, partial [Gammaproteobacteria bacterium]|nr:hypothetical protein [Gammaproteobacteria bacterium]